MSRPTLALCMIVKNEEANLPRLFKSFEGCFDEIHITDTGSTDRTVELAKELGATVHHFEWIHDFAAARNYSFSHATTDYVMWLDGDDELQNKEALIKWRDTAMQMADYWTASYHYTVSKEGKPICSFVRERAVKRSKELQWKYFVHEGIMPLSPHGKIVGSHISTWSVHHLRTEDDLVKDKSRNINIFELHAINGKLDPRMTFYYGKELFEAQRPAEAAAQLMKAAQDLKIEVHDRILAIQYACYSYIQLGKFEEALGVALAGVNTDSNRAEFYCLAGDALLKQKKYVEAIPLFNAAKFCANRNQASANMVSPIFTFEGAYTGYPRKQLTRLYAQLGNLTLARQEIEECVEKYTDEEAVKLLEEINKIATSTQIDGEREKTEDIVISCPAHGLYEWDEGILAVNGIGGSETAAVMMAKHLSEITDRKVIVFNNVKEARNYGKVEYKPAALLNPYFSKYEPKAHIAWRHNAKITKAPTYLWCHDLLTPGMQDTSIYEKVLALSPFHKDFIIAMTGLSEEKIHVTRNGVIAERFDKLSSNKEYGKVVFTSSPDRGLDKAMLVMDEIVKDEPRAKLHIYYGFDNMEKFNLKAEVARYKSMIEERKDYVIYHGNTEQTKLMDELSQAQVWLYPTDFQETFCITALEMIGCKVYPVVHSTGALQNTLQWVKDKGCADLLDFSCDTLEQRKEYATRVVAAIREESWKKINENMNVHDWSAVAREWASWLISTSP